MNEFTKMRTDEWTALLKQYEESGMERIDIWGDSAPEHPRDPGFKAGLYLYPILPGKRGIFIICAGGAFLFKYIGEAAPVAEFFHRAGINVAILDYSVDPDYTDMFERNRVRLNAGLDALRAVRYLRANAEELGIDPGHIAVGGFSAGGMTSQQAAVFFDYGDPNAADPLLRVSSRPDAVLLLYGAFTVSASVGTTGFSMEEQRERASTDPVRLIGCDCPPVFMFQTLEDDTRSSLMWATELVNRGIPYEIHIFKGGPHGAGLYDGSTEPDHVYPHTAHWAPLAEEWLKLLGFTQEA